MLRSLYSGVSGMRSFQTKMDVIANNIANVNTTGFKSGRAKFQDMLSQTSASAQSPMGNLGGVNPQQIGLGVRVGSIDTIMTGGALQPTNRSLDFALEGDGFFVLQGSTGSEVYSRDGAFFADYVGNLTNASGLKVMGYAVEGNNRVMVDANGTVHEIKYNDNKKPLEPLKIPQVVNQNGEPDTIKPGENPTENQYELDDFAIDGTGTVVGVYVSRKAGTGNPGDTNYKPEETKVIRVALGKVGLAKFANPEGLEKAGNNNYVASNNSGPVQKGKPGDGGYGLIRQGFLEMSNVDLANEFTEMIVTSRAYQANSRSITTSDEMLQELINLKR